MKKRLLTISHSYVVGLNRRLADEIARTGEWDVTVVAPARFRGDFGWHRVEVDARERCRVVGVPVRFGRRVHLMWYGPQLGELLRQPWDLVHCWEEPYVAAAGQVASLTPLAVPLAFATFQNISKRYPPPFSMIERYVLDRADVVIAFGETARSVLSGRGFSQSRTCVIPPGVDTFTFKPDSEARRAVRCDLNWSDDIPVVGFVGRFVHEKGLELLMRALDGVRVPWRALFVGAGPLERTLRGWAEKHHGRVALATSVGHHEVPRYLNAMDVLCAPSQTMAWWREQFGRMLIEAFACGVPVVASGSGEIPHVVGDAGIIVGERDTDAWSSAIESLITDRARRAELSDRGRGRAVSKYDWPVVARRHCDMFDALIAGGRSVDRSTAGSAA